VLRGEVFAVVLAVVFRVAVVLVAGFLGAGVVDEVGVAVAVAVLVDVLVDFATGSDGGMYSICPPPTAWLAWACHSVVNSREFPAGYVSFHFPPLAWVADASSDGAAIEDAPPHDEQPMRLVPFYWFGRPVTRALAAASRGEVTRR
jgi:hypothetical protein